MLHFNCPPISSNPQARALVFSWDPATGEVTGPDADLVRSWAVPKTMVPAHPVPWGVRLGAKPLRSKRDMALLIGVDHVVPEELRAHYPQPPPEPEVQALDGTRIGWITS